MLALVIDTSSAAVTAGLVRLAGAAGDRPAVELLAERVTIDARAHGELLAPSVAAVLTAAGVRVADLDAIVVGLGPGPFTGLRVGLVTAAAIADVRGIPAYGVCSLDGIAAAARHDVSDPGITLIASDARRKEVYWAVYRGRERIAGPEVDKPAQVPDRLRAAGLRAEAMAGAGARLYAEQLALPMLDADYPTVVGLAACAADRVLAGAPTEVLSPLYLRRPDAVAAATSKPVSQ